MLRSRYLGACCALFVCGLVPQPARAIAEQPGPHPGRLVDSGLASTYGEGDGFQGRLTACGQPFDPHVPQVAHKWLPCGTRVRIEDTTTGRSVVAEVTDRGPYVRGRVVDLSTAAFAELHPGGPGLLRVNVYVVAEPDEDGASAAARRSSTSS